MSEYRKAFFRKNHFNFVCSIVVCICCILLNLYTAFLLKNLTEVAGNGSMQDLFQSLMKYGIFIVAEVLVLFAKREAINRFGCKAMRQYKDLAFQKLLNRDLNENQKETTGTYISIFTNDIPSIEANYVKGNITLMFQVVSFIGAIVTMCYLSWIMTIFILLFSIPPIAVSALFGNKQVQMEKHTSKKNEHFTGLIKDLLSGITVIKNYKAEKEVNQLFQERNRELEETKKQKSRLMDKIMIYSAVASSFLNGAIFGVGALLAVKGYITAGTVIAFVQLLNFVVGPIQQIGPLWNNRKSAIALIDKMEKLTKKQETNELKECVEEFKQRICIQDLSFGYEDGNQILNGINLEFEKGKSYVLVGSSGSGKSTLMNLLLGQLGNYTGTITMDGKDLRGIKQESIYDLYSVIQQNVFVFDHSIENNITMFKPCEKGELQNAIQQSGLTALIQDKGLEYLCGENGCNLSGGEKQRVSIARSLIRHTPILVMDEATSALDPVTAQQVETSIAACEGLTRIVISHKLEESVLRLYDEIIVLGSGKVLEKGSFDELICQHGAFEKLFEMNKMALSTL